MYEFLIGNPPFLATQYGETYRRISKVDLRFPSDKPISSEAKDLIRRLLQHDGSKRLKLKDLPQHPFIRKFEQQTDNTNTVTPMSSTSSSLPTTTTNPLPSQPTTLAQ